MAGPGSQTHEFQVLAETGEDELVCSDSYGANIETAVTTKTLGLQRKCNEDLKMIETPNANTCEDVGKFEFRHSAYIEIINLQICLGMKRSSLSLW